MTRRIVTTFLLVSLYTLPAATAADRPKPELDRLKAHVTRLASKESQGRRGEAARLTAQDLVRRFRGLGLQPLFGESYTQEIPGQGADAPAMGRNVGGLLRGTDPALKDEYVIVSAHFDHLGARGDDFYPGADDNASGVAMMLEVARCFVQSAEKPKRTVLFVGFDLEEAGLYGSRYFAENSPVPLGAISLFVTADMIGRSLGGVCKPFVFVMGTEHAPETRAWLAGPDADPALRVGLLGSDVLLLDRSDYGPFRSRKVPFLFFSTGENPVYHTTRDTADTLDYPKLTSISRLIDRVAWRAASEPSRLNWRTPPDHPLAEALTIRDVVKTMLAHQDDLKIGGPQAFLMRNALRTLDDVEKRGTVTPEERRSIVRVARVILLSVF